MDSYTKSGMDNIGTCPKLFFEIKTIIIIQIIKHNFNL